MLDAALEVSTRAHEALAHRGMLPSLDDSIRRGLRWKPEPFTDGEHFDLAPEAIARGWADCDDLAPWRAAELRAKGINAQAVVIPSGPNRWHALVRMPNGEMTDPSKDAGMGKGARSGVHGATYTPLASRGQHAVGLLPHGGGWMARCDLPYGNGHVACVGFAPNPDDALTDALSGYALVGEGCEEEIDPEVGLWGIPGTKSVTFRDVLKVGLPIVALAASGGNPVAAAAAYKAGMWAYDAADDYQQSANAPIIDRLMEQAIADAKAGKGLVLIRADGTVNVSLSNGMKANRSPAGVWTANPPNFTGNAQPPPPPPPPASQGKSGGTAGRVRNPPAGFDTWGDFRTAVSNQADVPIPGPPPPIAASDGTTAEYGMWGEYYLESGVDPPEYIYPYLTAEHQYADSIGFPMRDPTGGAWTGVVGDGMPPANTLLGAIYRATAFPGPKGRAKVLWGEDEDTDGSLTWHRGIGGPVLLRV